MDTRTDFRYVKGSAKNGEAILFDIKLGEQIITGCTIHISSLLAGLTAFYCDNGDQIILEPEHVIEVLELLKAERKKITDSYPVKTYDGWQESGLETFEEYCFPGDEVDNAIVEHFINSVPPTTLRADCTQAGEAYSTEPDGYGSRHFTYTTFHREGERWIYDGLCFQGCNANRVQKPYCNLKIDRLVERTRREIRKELEIF